MGLQLSDAIVIVVVIVLLYYVLFKRENFDPKVDMFPNYFPPWWNKAPVTNKKAWVMHWADNMNAGQRNAYNNKTRAYMIQYAKGNISKANNKGAYVQASSREFWDLYKKPVSK